jgi:hypothetical protein
MSRLIDVLSMKCMFGLTELPTPQKVQLDTEYRQRRSLLFDLKNRG